MRKSKVHLSHILFVEVQVENIIEILGVYNIENNNEVYLIEVCIDDIASKIIIDQITQETSGLSKENWQVAYDEHYLDITGTQVVGYF